MTKEEFEIKKEDINERKLLLIQELKQLESDYIESNKSFNIGDKIKTSRNELGIVEGFRITYSNRVEAVCKKVKKDGTASAHNLFIWSSDTIELVNN